MPKKHIYFELFEWKGYNDRENRIQLYSTYQDKRHKLHDNGLNLKGKLKLKNDIILRVVDDNFKELLRV